MALNNELIFSYIDNNNKVNTFLFNAVGNNDDYTSLDGPVIQSTDSISKATVGRKSNYNPNNTSDPYGYNSNYRLKYANYHTLNHKDDRASVHINTFTIEPMCYMGTVYCNILNTGRVSNLKDNYMRYKVKTIRYLYDSINSAYTPKLFSGMTFHTITGSGYLTYTLSIDNSKDTGDKRFPTRIHSNMVPNFGTYTINESPHDKTFVTTFSSSNIGNVAPKNATVALRLLENSALTSKNDLFNAGYGMKTSSTVLSPSDYRFSTEWDNKVYKDMTGTSLELSNFVISGVLVARLLGPNGIVLAQQEYDAFSNEFTHPTTTPNFFRVTTSAVVSGYVNYDWLRVNMPADDALVKGEVVYQDEFNNWKIISVPQGGQLKFWKNHRDLNGKVLRIKSYYKTITNDVKLFSDTICSAYHNYFDINDVTLTMSGIRYDPVTSGTQAYRTAYLEEDDGSINTNYIGTKFQTMNDVWTNVAFTLNTNETDIYDNVRTKSPAPDRVWLMAVPLSAKNDADVRGACLQLPQNLTLRERDTIDKMSLFPSVTTAAASGIIALCTGSPNIPTAKGIMWNSNYPTPVYDAPEVGEFLTNTYTINVKLNQNSWIFYLVIRDSVDNYSAYCVSNPPYFDIPTADKFET